MSAETAGERRETITVDRAAPWRPVVDLLRRADDATAWVEPELLVELLRAIGPIRRQVDLVERVAIAAARREGMTWRQIAECLGLESPQAAQQRHARLGPRTACTCADCRRARGEEPFPQRETTRLDEWERSGL